MKLTRDASESLFVFSDNLKANAAPVFLSQFCNVVVQNQLLFESQVRTTLVDADLTKISREC